MKRFMLFFGTLLFCSLYAMADDYDTLYQRLFDDYVAASPATQATIQGFMDTQQADGSWLDINYDDHTFVTGWKPLTHFDRLSSMALVFKKTGNYFYNNTTLKAKIKLGLLYWYNRVSQPYSNNWFDNDIGKQERLYKILTLIKNDFSTAPDWTNVITTGCDKYLILPSDYATSTYKSTPTNAVWIARNLVHNGVIKKDQAKLQQGINNMALQLVVQAVRDQGMQRDNAYLIHWLQVYNAGYGNWLMGDVSYYMYQTRGLTLVGFNSGNISAISDLLLNGDQWMAYGKMYDFGTGGRNISRKGGNGLPSAGLKTILSRMQLIDPAKNALYQTMYNHLNDPTGATTGITGNKYFWRGDYMVQRRPNLFIGVKMCSNRTVGTEGMNSENLLGHWLPFGATTVMRKANEYYDIFGLWDWTKIPGVTNPAATITWPLLTNVYSTQQTSFVGGVSDGSNGITGMDLNRDTTIGGVKIDILAKKANFLWNSEMVCLGAGISSTYSVAPTTTTLNQSYLNGPVLINGTTAPQGETAYTNVRWINHDSTGYVFRTNTTIKLKTNLQSGNWYTINQGQPNAAVSANVFKLWLDHGAAPANGTYEYVVLPNSSSAATSAYAGNMTVETNSNTTALQAVTHKTLLQTGAVFYSPGTVYINGGLKIAVDKPCILLIDFNANPIKITASDPTQTQSALTATITYSDIIKEDIVFSLPYGDLAGSSVTKLAQTVRLIDERFYGLGNMTAISGGTWSTASSTLQLANPASNAVSIPANIAISNTAVTGDFVMSAKAKVTGTSSTFNDFCLIWNHQQPTDSYYYAHFSETNDAAGSGIFKIVNGVKSAQLADITTAIVADTWTNLVVQKVGTTMTVFINGVQVAQVTDASLANGYVGLGSYNDACQFQDLSVIRYNTAIQTMALRSVFIDTTAQLGETKLIKTDDTSETSIKVYPNPNKGTFTLIIPDDFIKSNILVYDINGNLLYNKPSREKAIRIMLNQISNGILSVVVEKNGKKLFKKVLIQ